MGNLIFSTSEETYQLIVGIIFLCGFAITSFFTAVKAMKRYRLIQDIPTSKIRAVAIGLAELTGTISANQTIKTPLSQIDCIYYQFITKEYRRHSDKSSHCSWNKINSQIDSINFWLNDDTGMIQVNPKEIETIIPVGKVFLSKYSLGTLQAPTLLENNREPIFASVGDRLYLEYFIKPQDKIYVMGTVATNPEDPRNVYLNKGSKENISMISNQSEKNLTKSLKIKAFISFILGTVSVTLAVVLTAFLLRNI